MNPKPKALTILDIVSIILFLAAVYIAIIFAPLEAVMGWVQKVFYFHVATAWVGMMGFMVAGVAGIIYLWKKDLKWDIVEVASQLCWARSGRGRFGTPGGPGTRA
jgi:heme exporter protein C